MTRREVDEKIKGLVKFLTERNLTNLSSEKIQACADLIKNLVEYKKTV